MLSLRNATTYWATHRDSFTQRGIYPEREQVSSSMVEGLHRQRLRPQDTARTLPALIFYIRLRLRNVKPSSSLHQRVELRHA